MRVLIIGSGQFSKRCLDFFDDVPFVICADGGYDKALENGIVPDAVLGDMDSVLGKVPKNSIIYPSEKDETDSEIAIDYALKNGFSELVLAGFTGTRLDHTLNNILILKRISEAGASGVIVDDNNEIYYLRDKLTVCGKKGELLSIIPVFSDLVGVTAKNLKYPLFNETLFFGKGRGVSNVFLDNSCTITVTSGEGIVIKSKD